MSSIPLAAGLLGLHHIGYLVRDVEEAAAHYIQLLGYQRESVAIDDPTQTARVLFLRQPGAHFWLELIAPLGPESKLATALRKGGGLHHLCYEVEQLEPVLAHMREARCFVLCAPVPAVAFGGRRIAWVMDSKRALFEFIEKGPGPLSLSTLK